MNLVAEVEHRLIGSAAWSRLHAGGAAAIPSAASYVLVLFDGLGDGQLSHPEAASIRADRAGALDTVFPTTTTTALASVATGLPPAAHGLLGYQLWLPEADTVVNTIKWTTLWGEAVEHDYDRFLPAPNLWERLAGAGAEPVTVQPGNFTGSPLSRVLYRGCRWEPAYTVEELVEATLELAGPPGRLVFTYVPHVDFAAHVFGQHSTEYAEAMQIAAAVWERLAAGLPPGTTLVGTADHGHVDIPRERQLRLAADQHTGRRFYGDSRAMFVNGDGAPLAAELPATWVAFPEMEAWWGPGKRHPAFDARAPDGALVADEGWALLHRHSDDRLTGHHGALTDAERTVPLLVALPA